MECSMRGKTLIGALVVTGLAITGCGAAKHASATTDGHAKTSVKYSQPGVSRSASLARCNPAEIAVVSAIRPGAARAAIARLAPPPLAQFDDSADGELAFFSPARLLSAGPGSPLSHAPEPVLA